MTPTDEELEAVAIALAEAIPCDHGSLCSHSREAARLAFAAVAPLVLERAAQAAEGVYGEAFDLRSAEGKRWTIECINRIRALKGEP